MDLVNFGLAASEDRNPWPRRWQGPRPRIWRTYSATGTVASSESINVPGGGQCRKDKRRRGTCRGAARNKRPRRSDLDRCLPPRAASIARSSTFARSGRLRSHHLGEIARTLSGKRTAGQLDLPPLFNGLPQLAFVAILLNAGDAEPGETVAINQMLPVDEFIHRKSVATAGFLEASEAHRVPLSRLRPCDELPSVSSQVPGDFQLSMDCRRTR